jgi:hypothetical protein
MKRRIFNAAAIVSLVLCVGTVALGVRSFSYRDLVTYEAVRGAAGITSELGRIEIEIAIADAPRFGSGWGSRTWPAQAAGGSFRQFYLRNRRDGGLRHWLLAVPHWFLMAITSALPIAAVVTRSWRAGPRQGHCPSCGYDIRATPDRCPECGTEVSQIAS